ncbi:MAG: hypothetical protein M3353_01245 [Actinomycetota bacterium]|nr:hypothetical protein [Actinomycetota bacterium]
MPQLSLFSADARARELADLAGLLCGPGQIVRFGASDTARLSIVLADPRRASALTAACVAHGLDTELATTPTGATVLRTSFRQDLVALADAWTRGAVKASPVQFELDGPVLRWWALSAGRGDGPAGYTLGLDPHAPNTHTALATATGRLGLSSTRLGVRGGGPALRITGVKRLRRLAELVGPLPDGLACSDWPSTG